MGVTAENLAAKYGISRLDQDRFALLSHQRAIQATDEGRFKEEIVPISITERKKTSLFDTDEHPRRDTTLESLATLKPSFKPDGTVTPGNSSGINDGACGMIIMSETTARELGVPVMGKILSTATTGVDPDVMGIGPVSASEKALRKAGLGLASMELVELNEAFAAQYLACEKVMGLDREITNVNGGGIALGHPVGCSGARIMTTLLFEMKSRNAKRGLATLCAGGGMGTAVVLARD